MKRLIAALLIAIVARFSQAQTDTTSPQKTFATNSASGEASVELTASKLNAIKVEPIGTHLFAVEKEAVGNVSFDEDPAIVQAESTLVGAAATFDSTRKELARITMLGETNGIAPKEIEQATADHQSAAAGLKAARAALRALGITEVEMDDLATDRRISGTGVPPVSYIDSQGQNVRAATYVAANISEIDSPLLRTGQIVQVRVEAFPDRQFNGRVSRVYATIDPNTHRKMIRCSVEDPANELRPGMLANVTIRVNEPIEATAIPADGVVRESDGTMTGWVTSDQHRFTQRKLRIGIQKDGYYQVLEGLRPGELAVTEGAVFLSNILNAPPSDD